jgi:hypothetical protein
MHCDAKLMEEKPRYKVCRNKVLHLRPTVTGAFEFCIGNKLAPRSWICPPPSVGRPSVDVVLYEKRTGALYENEDAIETRPTTEIDIGRAVAEPDESAFELHVRALLDKN